MLADMRAPFPSKEESWERLVLRIEAAEPNKDNFSWLFKVSAVAAGLALVIGLFFFTGDSQLQIETLSAQMETVTLPDGSVVTMNAMSSISYDEDAFLTERTLELDGEAFFQVEKGSKFKVVTNQGTISVLGTSFNICDRKNLLEVHCETGKVAVSNKDNRVILTPGKATDNKAGRLSEPFEKARTQTWIKGTFSFQEDNLAFVLDEIERQFAVTVERPDLNGMIFTGEFDSSDLETALTVVCQPMGLEYRMTNNSQIVLTLK